MHVCTCGSFSGTPKNSSLTKNNPSRTQYHVIGFEGLVDDDTSEYIHHLVVSGWTGSSDCGQSCLGWYAQFSTSVSTESSNSSSSSSSSSPASSSYSYSTYFEKNNITVPDYCNYSGVEIFAWTPGMDDVKLPDDVGFLFGNGSEGGMTSVSVQTHYDNPNGDTDKLDSSGVRVYFTDEVRPIEMGVMRLGDPFVAMVGTPIPDGKSTYSFDCPGSCTEEYFEVRCARERVKRVSFFLLFVAVSAQHLPSSLLLL